jgi:hypothetical protein
MQDRKEKCMQVISCIRVMEIFKAQTVDFVSVSNGKT